MFKCVTDCCVVFLIIPPISWLICLQICWEKNVNKTKKIYWKKKFFSGNKSTDSLMIYNSKPEWHKKEYNYSKKHIPMLDLSVFSVKSVCFFFQKTIYLLNFIALLKKCSTTLHTYYSVMLINYCDSKKNPPNIKQKIVNIHGWVQRCNPPLNPLLF